MEIILKSNGTDILLRREELAGNKAQSAPLTEKKVSIQHDQFGCITDTQITTGNFLIAHSSFQLTQPVQLIQEVEEAIVQLYFALRGESQAQPGGKATQRHFSTGQHNISYLPQAKSGHEYGVSAQPLDFSVVIIPKDIYARLVPVDNALHRQLFAQTGQPKAAYFSANNLPISPAMNWIIRDMRTSQRTGALKHLLLESRILELLMLQLEQMQGSKAMAPSSKGADVRKIHEACELLDAYYPNPPTIIELAKLVGLNEFSLKRGFKEQIGTTILGYITKRRMEDARRLLLEREKTISEISYWVGYKNPAHFTVAFKHYFGMLPSAVLP